LIAASVEALLNELGELVVRTRIFE
jgi:hypothetical protein